MQKTLSIVIILVVLVVIAAGAFYLYFLGNKKIFIDPITRLYETTQFYNSNYLIMLLFTS